DFGPGQLIFERAEYSVREDGGTVALTVLRTNGSTGVISVIGVTTGMSATSGEDFVGTNTVIAFADGEIRKTFSIAILDDNIAEVVENFRVDLAQPTG